MRLKLRVQSGKEVVNKLLHYGFVLKRTAGSHARLTLDAPDKRTFHISIPLHSELKRGTLRGIISELEKYIPQENITNDFYIKS